MLIPKTKQEKKQFISAMQKLNEFLTAKGEGEIPKADIETNVYDFVDAIETMDEKWLDELPDEVINMYNHLVSDELAESEQEKVEEKEVEQPEQIEEAKEEEAQEAEAGIEAEAETEETKFEGKPEPLPKDAIIKKKPTPPKKRSKFETMVRALQAKSPCTMDEWLEEAERMWGRTTTDMKWYLNGVAIVLKCVGVLEEKDGKLVLKR